MSSITLSPSLENNLSKSFDFAINEPISLQSAEKALAALYPEIIERAARDEAFRDSILKDTAITLNALLSGKGLGVEKLPGYMQVIVVEDTADTMHLVIPAAFEAYIGSFKDNSSLGAILLDASRDPELQNRLIEAPHSTIQSEMRLRGEYHFDIDRSLAIKVLASEAGQLTIVLPERTKTSPLAVLSESGFDASDANSLEASDTSYDRCRHTNDYCQTSFTQCGNGCGTSGCWTHTMECKRTPTY